MLQKILVNPSFSALSEETEDAWEGCLSLPGLRELVKRYKSISYTAQDIHGHPCQVKRMGLQHVWYNMNVITLMVFYIQEE